MAKVLIVEDTEVNRLVLSRRLEKLGFEVVTAVDGQEGLDKANQEMPDIIIMDMYLPKIDGGEVTQRSALSRAVRTRCGCGMARGNGAARQTGGAASACR